MINARSTAAQSSPRQLLWVDKRLSAAIIMKLLFLSRGASYATTSKAQCEMAILVRLDEKLYERRMTLTELAARVDITVANLSIRPFLTFTCFDFNPNSTPHPFDIQSPASRRSSSPS